MSYSLERRKSQRFTINLSLRFTVLKCGVPVETGMGRIRDVSKDGILFECAQVMEPGTVLRLNVDWPVPFLGTADVEWLVESVVSRSDMYGTAVRIMRYRFERRSNIKSKEMAG